MDEDAEIVMILTDSYFSFNPNAGLNDDGSLKEGWAITKDRYDNLSDDDKEMFSPLAFIFSMNERDDQGKMPYYIEADEDIAEIYLYDPQNNDIGYSLEAGPGNEMEGYQKIPESIEIRGKKCPNILDNPMIIPSHSSWSPKLLRIFLP